MPQQNNNQQQEPFNWTQTLLSGGSLAAALAGQSELQKVKNRRLFDAAYDEQRKKTDKKYQTVQKSIEDAFEAGFIDDANREKALDILDEIDRATGSRKKDPKQQARFDRLTDALDATSKQDLEALESRLKSAQQKEDVLTKKLQGREVDESKPAKNIERTGELSKAGETSEQRISRRAQGQIPLQKVATEAVKSRVPIAAAAETARQAAVAESDTAKTRADTARVKAAAAAPKLSASITAKQSIVDNLKSELSTVESNLASTPRTQRNKRAALEADIGQKKTALAKAEKDLAMVMGAPKKLQESVTGRIAAASKAETKVQETTAASESAQRRVERARNVRNQATADIKTAEGQLSNIAKDKGLYEKAKLPATQFISGEKVAVGLPDIPVVQKPDLTKIVPRLPFQPAPENVRQAVLDELGKKADPALKAQAERIGKGPAPFPNISPERRARTEGGRILAQNARVEETPEMRRGRIATNFGRVGVGLAGAAPAVSFFAQGMNMARATGSAPQGDPTKAQRGVIKLEGGDFEDWVRQDPRLGPRRKQWFTIADKLYNRAGLNIQKVKPMLTPDEKEAMRYFHQLHPTFPYFFSPD